MLLFRAQCLSPPSEGVSLAEAMSQLGAGAILCHGPQHAAAAAAEAAVVGGARATKNTRYLFAGARKAHLGSDLTSPTHCTAATPPASRVVDTLPDKGTDRQKDRLARFGSCDTERERREPNDELGRKGTIKRIQCSSKSIRIVDNCSQCKREKWPNMAL